MRIQSHKIEMLATNGDHRLGGKDWDDVIVNYVAEEFDRAHGENPLLDLQSYQDLQSRALCRRRSSFPVGIAPRSWPTTMARA